MVQIYVIYICVRFWLRVPERIQFRLCVLAFRCLYNTAPSYLVECLHRTTDIDARRRLRSAAAPTLLVPITRRSRLGDRAFSVAAPHAWNGLPAALRGSTLLATFRRELKTVLFLSSFGPSRWRISISTSLQSHTLLFLCVQCPCNALAFKWHSNHYFCNNNLMSIGWEAKL